MNASQRPARMLEEEAFVNLLRTTDALQQALVSVLKDHGLSSTQYNVLRILRGAGKAGLPCGEVGARMITRDPDITRLLDKLEARELVARQREKHDRRVITVRITEAGLRLVSGLDEPIREIHGRQLGHLGAEKLKALIGLLEAARRP